MAQNLFDQVVSLSQYRLTARNRALRLLLDRGGENVEESLLPQYVSGTEDVCGGFEYRIFCVAESATLALKDFIGLPCELQVVTDRGDLRRFCGIVTQAASGQSDGGLATYQLVMRDALSVMEQRINTRVFCDKTEREIIEVLVREWQARNPILAAAFHLQIDSGMANRELPVRGFIMQHNESDATFVRRLLQRRGIAWYFRPGLANVKTGSAPRAAQKIGHTLVLFDDPAQLSQCSAGMVRFHRDAATEQRDSITAWSAVRKLQPGSVSLHSWNYMNPAADTFMVTQASSEVNQGEHGNQMAAALETYCVVPPHLGRSPDDLDTLAGARMAHHEYMAKCFIGEGGVRDLAVGQWFGLTGHPELDTHPPQERQFVVTSQRIEARNNLPQPLGERVERLFDRNGWSTGRHAGPEAELEGEQLQYRTSFTCVRRGIRIVPPQANPPQLHLQTAIVVGPENEAVWCDQYGRVKVRFPATRPEDHAHASGAGSANAAGDSAWVRVASSWAGNGPGAGRQCGTRLLPPVGAEVLVDFAGGDPDKPVIIGQVYNVNAPPPAFKLEDAVPDTRFQSGIRSREVHGLRGNQLRLDDTQGQISAQLASDHAAAELNLGYLTEHRQRGAAAAARGEGAELRTGEAIALHAARGILLSAWKLLGGANTKGPQLAREDFLRLLHECGDLCGSLGAYSAEHNGLPIDAKDQTELLTRFTKWDDGSNVAPKVTEAREPVVGITSPAGIGFASSKAIVSYSATNVDTAAQQHLQLTAGQRFTVNAGKGVSVFAHSGGLNAIAHNGKLVLQSQRDDTEIDSAKNMQLTACEGTTTISAKVILLVAEDGSILKLGDGPPVFGSKHPLHFHAPAFNFDGPESMASSLPQFDGAGADQRFEVRYAAGTAAEDGTTPLGGLVKAAKLKVAVSDGSELEMMSGEDGKSDILTRDAMHMVEVALVRGAKQ